MDVYKHHSIAEKPGLCCSSLEKLWNKNKEQDWTAIILTSLQMTPNCTLGLRCSLKSLNEARL